MLSQFVPDEIVDAYMKGYKEALKNKLELRPFSL